MTSSSSVQLSDNSGWHIDGRLAHDRLYSQMQFCIDPRLYALFSQFKMDSDLNNLANNSSKDELEQKVNCAIATVKAMQLGYPRLPEETILQCQSEPNNNSARLTAGQCGGPNLAEFCLRCGEFCPVRVESKWRSGELPNPVSSSCSFKQFDLTRNVIVPNALMANESVEPIISSFRGNSYLIPARSSFVLSDVYDAVRHLAMDKRQFDVIIMDPPWDNKSVRRKRSYRVESERFLYKIPFESLLKHNGLVVMWITNKKKFQDFVINDLFPSVGLQLLARWHWSKITQQLEPICETKSNFKTSFETILIGNRIGSTKSTFIDGDDKVIVSVPNACHSRKPPLQAVVNEVFGSTNVEYLELFARYLYPGTVSVGNEVIKFQHLSYFKRL